MSELAITIQPVCIFETWKLEARISKIENGEVLNIQWGYLIEPSRAYDGFLLQAYLGDVMLSETKSPPIWGTGFFYDVHRIESADHAAAIAKVMRKVEKGLADMNESEGYLVGDDFGGLVIRVGRILKINTLYVRNRPQVQAGSGEAWKKTSGMSLQWWLQDVAKLVDEGRRRELIYR